MKVHEIANLRRTPKGLPEEQLVPRFKAASILAEAHGILVDDILGDWFPCHIDYIRDLAEVSDE